MTDAPTPSDPYIAPADPVVSLEPASPVAGFWRRVGALLIDCLVVGLGGAALGYVLMDVLATMGGFERFIGFAIVLAYAGVLNSRIGGGQTPGKRLLDIRVTRLDGTLLSLPQALLRQTVFAIPFFLNGAPVSLALMQGPLAYLLGLAIFGGLFAIFYLFVFNRRNRRTLHDFAAGSVVVLATPPAVALPIAPVWRGHLVVVAVIAVVAFLAPLAGKQLAKQETFAGMLDVVGAMEKQPGVLSARFNVMTMKRFNVGTTTSVNTVLQLDHRGVEDEAFARDIARKVVAIYPPARDKDVVTVTLVYGYDMVIASGWRKASYSFEPDELE